MLNPQQDAPWHWQAHLQLELSSSERGSSLSRCRHKGPLYVQKPFYPEGKDYAHVYLLHPPGGMVSGDALTIDVTVKEQAHTVITTPGAARAYRAREASPIQRQDINLTLENNTSMEWFPMETIIFNGAAAELNTHIELTDASTFMGWEVTCLGLPASQQLMTHGYFTQRYQITQAGIPLFVDQLHFDAQRRALFDNSAGMQGKTVSGFFIAGPFISSYDEQEMVLESLRECLNEHKLGDIFAISFFNRFCVVRYLGHSANQARDGFSQLWEILRPELIQRPACHPRIWLT